MDELLTLNEALLLLLDRGAMVQGAALREWCRQGRVAGAELVPIVPGSPRLMWAAPESSWVAVIDWPAQERLKRLYERRATGGRVVPEKPVKHKKP